MAWWDKTRYWVLASTKILIVLVPNQPYHTKARYWILAFTNIPIVLDLISPRLGIGY